MGKQGQHPHHSTKAKEGESESVEVTLHMSIGDESESLLKLRGDHRDAKKENNRAERGNVKRHLERG